MFARDFHPRRFLRNLAGTAPFREYCRARGIPFAGPIADDGRRDVLRPWAEALSALPPDRQAAVELDLAEVNELSGRDALAHLLAAAGEETVPLDIPAGPPLALWVFLHRPDVFRDVLLHHEGRGVRSWRRARTTPGLELDDLPGRADALGRALRSLFRPGGTDGQFVAAGAYRAGDAYGFAAHVADRLRLAEGFTDAGDLAVTRQRPALTVLFAYEPRDGTVLLKSPLRSADRVRALFRSFGQAVLGMSVEAAEGTFDLDRLKYLFRPLPGAPDMEMVRVKALHLQYPTRYARRQVKLETLQSDGPDAVGELLRDHVQGSAIGLDELRVVYAELQVRLRSGRGSRTYLIRLWPDRSSLSGSPLGRRLQACVERWGLLHHG